MSGPSLVDEIERLGAMVDAGELGRAEAAHAVQQFSDGGLTYLGACDAVANWKTCRAAYEDVFRRAKHQLQEWQDRS